jgi:hypothetical protein
MFINTVLPEAAAEFLRNVSTDALWKENTARAGA